MAFAQKIHVRSVSELAKHLREIVEEKPYLRNIGIRGEVSGLSKPANGNVYFKLNEGDAVLSCVVWSKDARALPPIDNGQSVVAVGYVSTYQKRSEYQLVAHAVSLEGAGDVHAEIEKLKKKLEAEGAFAPERKRALPRYPFRLALVSSRDARGAGDFQARVARRAPHVEVVLVETPVQGRGSEIEIGDAIDRAARLDVDFIVVARGGGSPEDLLPFSTEAVARAILRARQHKPVVSAVGHDYDNSIADLVADARAETPSAAADRFVPSRDDLVRAVQTLSRTAERRTEQKLRGSRRELEGAFRYSALADPGRFLGPRHQDVDRAVTQAERAVTAHVRRRGERIVELERRLGRFDPRNQLAERGNRLEVLRFRLDRAAADLIARGRERVERAAAELRPAIDARNYRRLTSIELLRVKLDGIDPEAILQRGYAIVRYGDEVVRDPDRVPIGERVSAQLAHGTLLARVEERRTHGAE